MTDDSKMAAREETASEEIPTTSKPVGIRGNSVVFDAFRKAREELETEDYQDFTLERDDNRPLAFRGNLVGFNDVDTNDPRGTQVQIFVTQSGKIITAVYGWQRKAELSRERHKAAVHTDPEDALAWLIEDGGGKLGRSSRQAWDMACQVEPILAGHDVEVVD